MSDPTVGTRTVLFSRSTDAGRTWSASAEARPELREASYHVTELTLGTDGNGTWLLVRTAYDYRGVTTASHLVVDVTVSVDDGASWGAPSAIVNVPTGRYDPRYADSPRLRSNGDGTWILVWKARYEDPSRLDLIEMSRSTDNGATWSAPLTLNDDTGGTGTCCAMQIVDLLLDMDVSGNALVLWSGAGYPYPVFRTSSADAGASWTTHAGIEPGWSGYSNHPLGSPGLATDGEGLWMATWTDDDRTYSSDYQWLYLATSTDHGATWTSKRRLLFWYGAGLFQHLRLLSHGRGQWQIVWESTYSLGATIGSDNDLLTMYTRDDGSTWTYPSPLLEEARSDAGVVDAAFSAAGSGSSTAVAWRSTLGDDCAVRFAGAAQDCPSLPRPDCIGTSAPGGSSLKLATGIRDRITWKWNKGEETVASHIGSPNIDDDYVFCLYENDTAGPRLIGEWDAEAGRTCGAKPCWVADESRATYADRDLLEGSVRRIRIKGGGGRPSSLRADLAGLSLSPPAPPMNDSAAITMQLLNLGTGACWTGEHTATNRNDAARFESSSD